MMAIKSSADSSMSLRWSGLGSTGARGRPGACTPGCSARRALGAGALAFGGGLPTRSPQVDLLSQRLPAPITFLDPATRAALTSPTTTVPAPAQARCPARAAAARGARSGGRRLHREPLVPAARSGFDPLVRVVVGQRMRRSPVRIGRRILNERRNGNCCASPQIELLELAPVHDEELRSITRERRRADPGRDPGDALLGARCRWRRATARDGRRGSASPRLDARSRGVAPRPGRSPCRARCARRATTPDRAPARSPASACRTFPMPCTP